MSETSAEALDALLKLADVALYEAKGDGRNRIKRASRQAAVDKVSNVFRVASARCVALFRQRLLIY
jgi:hypothetical protein